MEKTEQPWNSSYTYQVSKHSAEMLHNLNGQRKDGGRFCDVILRVGEESFPAHKAVLAACSEYFESVFSCQTEDDGQGKELEMHTISPKVFRDILDFAYTSKIVVRLECFPELMTAAKFLLMRSVIEICQEVIKQSNVQILVPPPRGGEHSLFRAAEQLSYPLPVDMSNGSVSNGAVFTDNNDSDGADPTQPSNSSQPGAQAADHLAVSPLEFPSSHLNSDGSKRSRGRPKKEPATEQISYSNSTAQNEDGGLFPCGVCGKIFPDDVQLRNHHETQHGTFTGGVSGGAELVAVDGPTMTNHSQSRFQENGLPADNRKRERTRRHVACDLCGKVFRDVYHLNRHKLSHSGEKPYACPVCGLRFKRKDRMSYHVRSHDGSVGKPYVCQSCGKGFSRPDHLNGHIKQVHTTERPHKCQICNASFATRDRLRSHLACHEDKIPCQVCGKFLRAAYMTDHLKKHSEGPHNYCGICNKDGQENAGKCPHQDSDGSDAVFGDLSNGTDLKAEHKVEGEEMEVTSFIFNGQPEDVVTSPGGSKDIQKTDHEKKFACGECGQTFRTKSYLNKHHHRVHKKRAAAGSSLGDLGSPFSPQQNMSLLESFGFQIVQSAFASSLVDSEMGSSGMGLGEK
ncbi:POZ-, AT hook-, and zinc finger-containing protein 1 isoform X3 [Pimephales promelas]|uniref:POZ-, AT hook-, and zinc finger-containing protein 1 isoform X3 n=1 Tax=Pimephales promelas TaxID=90988 RepID=UPI0019557213|nr:POZ-, AT hook-, and zinc finger-containing protein 1 isoform X3 [Pimephales promelas]KAG1942726.1 myc-associated zinc finger protein [Pimephales promelas]